MISGNKRMSNTTNFKLLILIGVLLPLCAGCTPTKQGTPQSITPQPTTLLSSTPRPTISTSSTPTVMDTATSLPTMKVPAPPIMSLHMIDVDNGWAWTNSGHLLRTTDGGAIWIDRTPAGQVWPDGSFFLDIQTAWLTIYLQDSSRFAVLHTVDGGQTWTQYPYGPASGLHFVDALQGWAEVYDVGAGNVYITLSDTKDGGATWMPVPVIPPQPENGLPPGTVHLCNICTDSFYYDPGRMVIVYGDMAAMQPGGSVRMQVSFDFGKIWHTQNLPLPKENRDALVAPSQLTFFDDKNGILPVHLAKMKDDGSYAYQRLAIYATQDGGSSWSLLSSVLDNVATYLQAQFTSPKDFYVLCGNELCATHDSAQTWKPVPSNLDFTQTDTRSVSIIDFSNPNTLWASVMENESTTLYITTDAGATWSQINPFVATSNPVTINIDTNIPTPTPIPTSTPEASPTPNVVFDKNSNAYRIRFAPYTTWVEINDTISANASKRFILSAMSGQVMSVSIPQGPAFQVDIVDAAKNFLSDPHYQHSFWRGVLPATQDYTVIVGSQVSGAFYLRIAVNPRGEATQNFDFVDSQYLVGISYTDEFAPANNQVPIDYKGIALFTLSYIDTPAYYPTTNLSEAYLLLNATTDPSIVTTCTQPSSLIPEIVTGQVTVNSYNFTRSEFSGVAAGNNYDEIFYRTVWDKKCFEVVFFIHSTNIGNYPSGTVIEFDRSALLKRFEAVLGTFLAK